MEHFRSGAATSPQRQAQAAPSITQADLVAFHRKHFSGPAIDHFSSHFMSPCPPTKREAEEEDDRLGYYADGVKRTLTDEQIEIFRHSELEALSRKNIHSSAGRELHEGAFQPIGDAADVDDMEGDTDVATDPRKKKKKRGKGRNRKPEVKVDLRKRTWDVVDTGLHSLDYGDDEPTSTTPATGAPKRPHISYDDG